MQAGERSSNHPDPRLIRRAARGSLEAHERAGLDAHLAVCPTCAAELEAVSVFQSAIARDAGDDARDRQAIDGAMAHLVQQRAADATLSGTDEELDRVAVERAISRLGGRGPSRSSGRARFVRWAAVSVPLGAAAVAAIAFAVFHMPATTTKVPATTGGVSSTPPLILSDGSEIAPEGAATAIHLAEESPARTIVRLPAGAARFRVRHDARRLFRVEAGPVEIEDLGTVFRVAHQGGGRVRVSVSEGRVAVISTASRVRVELGAGDDRVFPAAADQGGAVEEARKVMPSTAPKTAGAPVRGPIQAPSRAPGIENPASLLAAADIARRSRSPRDAVASLRRVVERYPKDPRAPSAAFTLGWVLLTDLNRPRDAALAFAEAERIAPRGALAEDAAARVAEAWQKAGEPRRAATAAHHYAQAYPTGRYIALMRGLIGEN